MSKSSERISNKASPAFRNEDTHPAQQVKEIMLTFTELHSRFFRIFKHLRIMTVAFSTVFCEIPIQNEKAFEKGPDLI
jgi:hypothetical protein